MPDFLNETEINYLIRAFMNFKTVLDGMPYSETKEFILMGVSYILEKLSDPPVSRAMIIHVTRDINKLIDHSPLILDIDDVVRQVNMAAFVCSSTEEAFYVS